MAKGSSMGKDPSVSWVFNDWQGGTMTLSRFLKGCYMDLLTAQFNNGHLSLDEIKTVLGSDFGASWPTLQKKFKKTPEELFYNERLEMEIIKRKAYTKGRKENLEGNDEKPSPHMGNGNGKGKGNENGLGNGIIMPFESENFKNIWVTWIEYRGEIKKPYKSQKSEQGQLKELSKYNEKIAIDMIMQSINNGWQGIFELKNNYNNGAGKQNNYTNKQSEVASLVEMARSNFKGPDLHDGTGSN